MNVPPRLDPRTARTRLALREALADLLREKSFAEISYSDLAAYSGLSRATIYLHYRDKFDLLDDWVRKEFQARLVAALDEAPWNGEARLRGLVVAVCAQLDRLHRLGRTGDRLLTPVVETRMKDLIARTLDFGFSHGLAHPAGDPALATAMAAATILAACTVWLVQQSRPDPAGLATTVLAGLSGVMTPVLDPPPTDDEPVLT